LLPAGEVTLAPLAEAEVVADHQVTGAQTADQDLLDELLGGEGGKAGVEAPDVEAVDALVGNALDLLTQGGEADRPVLVGEVFAGMRLEGEHGRG
jgi:hypothetical protein